MTRPGLKETIKKYNDDIDTVGYDTVFDRRTQEGIDGLPIKIDTPPYYAVALTGGDLLLQRRSAD